LGGRRLDAAFNSHDLSLRREKAAGGTKIPAILKCQKIIKNVQKTSKNA